MNISVLSPVTAATQWVAQQEESASRNRNKNGKDVLERSARRLSSIKVKQEEPLSCGEEQVWNCCASNLYFYSIMHLAIYLIL